MLGFLSLKRRVCFADSRCKTTQRLLHIFMPWHVFFPQCSSIHVPSCLRLQQSQKRVDKKVQLSLRNVLDTTFLSVVVGCTRNNISYLRRNPTHYHSCEESVQSNELPRRSKAMSVFFARFLLYNSLQKSRVYIPKNGSSWLIILSNQTQSVHSSSNLEDKQLALLFATHLSLN